MKKTGIFNVQLMMELTKLRHMDQFVICDGKVITNILKKNLMHKKSTE